jgi:predicted enzyme related to lactoylglutathione lyase
MGNPFVHCELATTDIDKAKSFYTALFAWRLEDAKFDRGTERYTMIHVDGGTAGGIMAHTEQGTASQWVPYVGVDDVRDAVKKAQSLGARVVRDVSEVEGRGWFAIIEDPTGGTLGLWQDKAA